MSGSELVDGKLGLETALMVLILAPEAYLPLRQVGMQFHASADGVAASEEVFRVLETPLPERGDRTDVPDLRLSPLYLYDVTVRYPGRDEPALDGFDLELRPGEVVALTGPSGAGKSTVLSVLLGLRRAGARCGRCRWQCGGRVRADGVEAAVRVGAAAAGAAAGHRRGQRAARVARMRRTTRCGWR